MRPVVSFDFVFPERDYRKVYAVLDTLGAILFDGYDPDNKIQFWHVPLGHEAEVERVIEALRVSEFAMQTRELVVVDDVRPPDVLDREWNYLLSLGEPVGGAEVSKHEHGVERCRRCGQLYDSNDVVPEINVKLLRNRSAKLMHFYHVHKVFCRPSFVEAWEKASLTGLSFEPWGVKDRQGRPLSLVRTAKHDWQDRTGVCEMCGMKTNVTTVDACFNVNEQFKYDFQFLRTFNGTAFVISQAAFEFMETVEPITNVWDEDSALGIYPIVPGMHEELIRPEPKLFMYPEVPMRMIRLPSGSSSGWASDSSE